MKIEMWFKAGNGIVVFIEIHDGIGHSK